MAPPISGSGRWKARSPASACCFFFPVPTWNDLGRAVAEAAHFYKLGLADVVVFHDEIDLAPGKVRVKTGGRHCRT